MVTQRWENMSIVSIQEPGRGHKRVFSISPGSLVITAWRADVQQPILSDLLHASKGEQPLTAVPLMGDMVGQSPGTGREQRTRSLGSSGFSPLRRRSRFRSRIRN
jgi:hypothetical protein